MCCLFDVYMVVFCIAKRPHASSNVGYDDEGNPHLADSFESVQMSGIISKFDLNSKR